MLCDRIIKTCYNWAKLRSIPAHSSGIIYMWPAYEGWRYSATSSLIRWAHSQNDPCALTCLTDGLRTPCWGSPTHMARILVGGYHLHSRALYLGILGDVDLVEGLIEHGPVGVADHIHVDLDNARVLWAAVVTGFDRQLQKETMGLWYMFTCNTLKLRLSCTNPLICLMPEKGLRYLLLNHDKLHICYIKLAFKYFLIFIP